MRGRSIAAALTASVLLATSGCFMHSEKVPQKTAHITVANITRTSHAVSCTQVRWWLTVNINAAPAHVEVVLNLDSEKSLAESVNIDNFEDFTGVADAGAGNATAVFSGNKYIITGEAEGSKRNNPNVSTTAPFRIEVAC